MKRTRIESVIAAFFTLLFMYAALSKLEAYDVFRVQLSKSPFITRYATLTAWSLPLGEILTALALLVPYTRLLGLFSSLFLMSMFTAYIFAMTHFSYFVPCSCGGLLSRMSWEEHLYFNIACVLLAVAGIFVGKPGKRAPLLVLSSIAAPVGLIYILYSFTYQPNKEDNGFKRNFSRLAVIPMDTLPAKLTYGLLCGVTPHNLYVELVRPKNRVLQLGWDLKNARYYSFGLPADEKIWSRLSFQIDSPRVNIFAGNGPDVFKGDLDSAGHVLEHHYPYPLFMRGFAFADGEYLFRAFDNPGTCAQMPFVLWDPEDNRQIRKINPFTSSNNMGLESDGLMGFDTLTGQIAFVQFYKNGILTMDSDFHLGPFIKTIDTVLHGRTSAGSYREDGDLRFANNTPQFFVNLNADMHDGMVYINSLLRADNENKDGFDAYSDIDAYSLKTHQYQYSIKVPRLNNRKIMSFRILDDKLAACYPDGIVTYELVNP